MSVASGADRSGQWQTPRREEANKIRREPTSKAQIKSRKPSVADFINTIGHKLTFCNAISMSALTPERRMNGMYPLRAILRNCARSEIIANSRCLIACCKRRQTNDHPQTSDSELWRCFCNYHEYRLDFR